MISHAVTRGLDANVRMKPSGVEWLGDVPEHWTVCRLKHLSSHVVDCLHATPTYDGELQFPAIMTADLGRGRVLLDQVRLVSREVYEERIERLRPVAGDILYSREGERFGLAALVPPGVDFCLGQRMMMFRIRPLSAHPAYVMWLLNSEAEQVLATTAGATSPHNTFSDLNCGHGFPLFVVLVHQQGITQEGLTSQTRSWLKRILLNEPFAMVMPPRCHLRSRA